MRETYHPRAWGFASRIFIIVIVAMHAGQHIVAATLGAGWHNILFVHLADYPIFLWSYFTSTLSHAGFVHLALNLVGFIALAVPLERWIGSGRMTWLFLIGSAFAVLAQGHILNASALGASGGVYALMGAFVLLIPRRLPTEWRHIGTQLCALSILLLALPEAIALRVQLAGGGGIGHFSHLIGLLFGALWALAHRNLFEAERRR